MFSLEATDYYRGCRIPSTNVELWLLSLDFRHQEGIVSAVNGAQIAKEREDCLR